LTWNLILSDHAIGQWDAHCTHTARFNLNAIAHDGQIGENRDESDLIRLFQMVVTSGRKKTTIIFGVASLATIPPPEIDWQGARLRINPYPFVFYAGKGVKFFVVPGNGIR
jgi:hypothetical protein